LNVRNLLDQTKSQQVC